jgi:hypothetical protein
VVEFCKLLLDYVKKGVYSMDKDVAEAKSSIVKALTGWILKNGKFFAGMFFGIFLGAIGIVLYIMNMPA